MAAMNQQEMDPLSTAPLHNLIAVLQSFCCLLQPGSPIRAQMLLQIHSEIFHQGQELCQVIYFSSCSVFTKVLLEVQAPHV